MAGAAATERSWVRFVPTESIQAWGIGGQGEGASAGRGMVPVLGVAAPRLAAVEETGLPEGVGSGGSGWEETVAVISPWGARADRAGGG